MNEEYELGKIIATFEMVINMYENDISIKTISKVTKLPIAKVREIIKNEGRIKWNGMKNLMKGL